MSWGTFEVGNVKKVNVHDEISYVIILKEVRGKRETVVLSVKSVS